jgi:hypothetical protein
MPNFTEFSDYSLDAIRAKNVARKSYMAGPPPRATIRAYSPSLWEKGLRLHIRL